MGRTHRIRSDEVRLPPPPGPSTSATDWVRAVAGTAAIDLPSARSRLNTGRLVTAIIAGAVLAWALVNLAVGWVGFAMIVPYGFRGSGEAAISVARLFAAGVLLLMATSGSGPRLRWVAGGFLVLGFGQLVYGYLEPILDTRSDVNDALYQMILVRGIGAALFAIGLVPAIPPSLPARRATAIGIAVVGCFVGYWTYRRLDGPLPELVRIESLADAARERIAPMSWLTGWHWLLATIPLGLAILAAWGALKRQAESGYGTWLPLSIVLLAGSEVHDALWPSAYGTTLLFTSADFLRLAMAIVVVVGGTMELQRIATTRADLLAVKTEHARRLEELATIKRDFTAMVAHELGYPLSGIRRLTELLARDGLDPALRERTLAAILAETNTLDHLVADMQDTNRLESDELEVHLQPTPVGAIVEDARATTDAYHREPPLETALHKVSSHDLVLADRARIGQVIRNLLCNAAKFSPEGTRIRLVAEPAGRRRVRLVVSDNGPGIDPEDVPLIFEKFGRGRHSASRHVAGAGLGLYLSRRIAQAHGSDLTLRTRPGHGSSFAFELERAP